MNVVNLKADDQPADAKALEAFKRRMMTLSVEEVAAICGCSRQTISRLIHENVLPAVLIRSGKPGKNGRRSKHIWKVRAAVLERWLLAREKKNQSYRGAGLTEV